MSCPEDNVMAQFVRAELSAAEREAIEAHLDDCEACSTVVVELVRAFGSMLAPAPRAPTLETTFGRTDGPDRVMETLIPGAELGRYRVRRRLGAGGMGVVYVAHDPQLDRNIAIKVLRSVSAGTKASDGTEGQRRLLREAQAMARLSHPNVVSVHDVGMVDDQVFIAMEYIEGSTLGAWLADDRRGWKEIVRVFIEAGRGLAAAHRAGLVHRDFKPDNVMLGEDGQVRVMDFGLARAARVDADEDMETIEARADDPNVELLALTRTGAVIGTPAYMAPEQHAGDPTDAQTDQFSFCIALYEALYGQRPFEGDTVATLSLSVIEGKRRTLADERGVPAWVKEAVDRGLQTSPRDRHPSMDALLTKLSSDPSARRRWWWAAAGAVAVVAATVPATLALSVEDEACTTAAAEIAPAWAEHRDAVRDAFENTGLPIATGTFERVATRLDAYAVEWVAMHDNACHAAHAGSQSAALLDQRMACLDQRRRELASLVDVFAEADAALVQRAVGATAALRSVGHCGDVAALTAEIPLPNDAKARDAVIAVRAMLSDARALTAAGRYEDALAIADEALEAAERTGFPAVVVEGKHVVGALCQRSGKYPRAEKLLTDAYWEAAGIKHDFIAASAAIDLVQVVGHDLGRPDDAELWEKQAEAAVQRIDHEGYSEAELAATRAVVATDRGQFDEARRLSEEALGLRRDLDGPRSVLAGVALQNLGAVMHKQGKYAEAKDVLVQARDVLGEALGPDHPKVATVTMNIGGTLFELGEADAGEAAYREAAASYATVLGPDHTRVGDVMSNLGSLLRDQRRFDEAQQALDEALRIYGRTLDPSNPRILNALNNVGNLRFAQGHYEEAASTFERMRAALVSTVGEEHPNVALAHLNLGNVAYMQGELEVARTHYEKSLEIREATLPPDHQSVASSLGNLGGLLAEVGEFEEGRKLYERALAIRSKVLPEDHPMIASSLLGLARCQVGAGDAEAAEANARKALAIYGDSADPGVLSDAWFTLARALLGNGGSRAEVVALVDKAEAALVADLPAMQRPLDQLRDWKTENLPD